MKTALQSICKNVSQKRKKEKKKKKDETNILLNNLPKKYY